MKKLVVYFSASGVTKKVAESLKEKINADIFEIKPVNEYTTEDLDWTNGSSRCSIETKDKTSRPEIKEKLDSIKEYDTIYIGFPIWWYVCPHIINTFIESYDFTKKTVRVFCTSGSSGIDEALDDLRKTYPNINFKDGRRIGRIEELDTWI